MIRNPGDRLLRPKDSGVGRAGVGWRAVVRERHHGADRRASLRRGAGGAVPGRAGRDRGAALPGDLALGAGAHRAAGLGGAGLRAALGDAAGGALQRPRPRGAGRCAAAERQARQPADRRGALRLGRAGADAARGRRGVERPQGRRLDGAAPWAAEGAPAARLGGAEAHRLVGPGAAAAACARGDARAAGRLQGGLEAAVAQAKAAHPDRPVEVWAEDEHRLGLKPIRRRVWAPIGQRPVALGPHRYQWLHVSAFVPPTSGEAIWYLCSGLSKPFFAALLATFARETGAGRERSIILALDNAGWHGPEDLAVPNGIRLVFLPPYTPELQPAEHLWSLVDEPIANRHVASLDDLSTIVAARCQKLDSA